MIGVMSFKSSLINSLENDERYDEDALENENASGEVFVRLCWSSLLRDTDSPGIAFAGECWQIRDDLQRSFR